MIDYRELWLMVVPPTDVLRMSVVSQGSLTDVSNNISCNIQQCANDTKLYSVSTNYNNGTQFQQDLDRVTNWSKKWQLNFN